MKKKLSLALALAFAASVSGTTFAAANPFTDVPAGHWSYKYVQQLAKDGVVEGFNGKFNGTNTITRYEMAKIVATALAKAEQGNVSKADKEALDKLAAEYKQELENLGVRVAALEKKVGNIAFNGYLRERVEKTDNLATDTKQNNVRTRFRLDMTAPLDTDWTFKGRLEYNNNNYGNNGNWDTGSLNVAQAYLVGKAGAIDTVLVGRVPLALGQGLIAGFNSDNKKGADAVAVGFGKDVKVLGGIGRISNGAYPSAVAASYDIAFANIAATPFKDVNLSASYLKDKQSLAYKTTAFGVNYTGIKDIAITGEYAKNKSTLANDGSGYYYQVKYLGAQKATPGSFGVWAQYRDIDANFDVLGVTALDATVQQQGVFGSAANDVKGFEYGVEYGVFKNGVFTVKYEDLKQKTTDTKYKGVIGQLEVFF